MEAVQNVLLIVSDINITKIKELLRNIGCIIKQAYNESQAIEYMELTPPELIIVEIKDNQELDSFAFAQKNKLEFPILLISESENLVQKAKEEGFSAYWLSNDSDRHFLRKMHHTIQNQKQMKIMYHTGTEIVEIKTTIKNINQTLMEVSSQIKELPCVKDKNHTCYSSLSSLIKHKHFKKYLASFGIVIFIGVIGKDQIVEIIPHLTELLKLFR